MPSRRNADTFLLPASLRAAVEELSRQEGTSVEEFILSAVAEKVAAMRTDCYFADAKVRANFVAFRRILDREGGEPPREDDVLPSDLAGLGPKDCAW